MKKAKQIARTINNVMFAPIVLIIIIFLNSFSFSAITASIITIASLAGLLALCYVELLIQKNLLWVSLHGSPALHVISDSSSQRHGRDGYMQQLLSQYP